MPLTDTVVLSAKPASKAVKLADERGMYLLLSPRGSKLWRFDYRFDGRRRTLALGVYPDVSLKAARERRDQARALLTNGVDPGATRKAEKASGADGVANSFEVVAREWFDKQVAGWAETHADKVIQRLEKDVFPWLGKRPIASITAPDLLTVIRRIEARGAVDTSHRALQNCGQVFRYAVATGRAERDPTGDLRGALAKTRRKHYAAIVEPDGVGQLLRAIDAFRGTLIVRCALRLAPLVFVRPGELRRAQWSEFDLDKGEWNIPAERMKAKRPHLVPLARQAVAILRELHPLTGHRAFVFPGRDPKKPMSDAAVNAALRRMGYDTRTEITGHGFRAMARTILHEQLSAGRDAIEHQLAHRVGDPLGTAYNRTQFIKQRRVMMQRWADYLDRLRKSAKAVPIGRAA
jgi:integrase